MCATFHRHTISSLENTRVGIFAPPSPLPLLPPASPNKICYPRYPKYNRVNRINHQPDIDKIYLYAKNSYKAKHQLLIKKLKSVGLKHCNDVKASIKYFNMADIYKNIDE